MLALRHIGAAAVAVAFVLATVAITAPKPGVAAVVAEACAAAGMEAAACAPARSVAAAGSPAGHIPRIRSRAPA